jgi:hypothetical protein
MNATVLLSPDPGQDAVDRAPDFQGGHADNCPGGPINVPDDIGYYLNSGWVVVGFSTALSGTGSLYHTVLVEKASSVVAVTIARNRSNEIYRSATELGSRTEHAFRSAR